jgi:hypothetical protein
MPRGRPPSNLTPDEKLQKKFEQLPVEWRDKVATMTVEDLNAALAEVAKNENENQLNKENDQDLAEKKESYSFASAQYKEATTANKLRTKFLIRVLGDRGAL